MDLLIATSNQGKLKEIKEILEPKGFHLLSLRDLGFSEEIKEDGSSFYENALIKAKAVQKKHPMFVLADDSGLEVDMLNGKPGIHSARYAGKNSSQVALINKLLFEMKGVPFEKRGAQFVCTMVLLTPSKNIHSTTGICRGKINFHPTGNNGFGYDPVFLPEKYQNRVSMAELSEQEKNQISHRFHALRLLLPVLMQLKKENS